MDEQNVRRKIYVPPTCGLPDTTFLNIDCYYTVSNSLTREALRFPISTMLAEGPAHDRMYVSIQLLWKSKKIPNPAAVVKSDRAYLAFL